MNAPQLKRLEDFKEALADYKVSQESQRILDKTRLVLLSGVTSSGRNTIIRELQKTGEYHYIISDTTRPQRYNDGILEQNGIEYWFRSEDEVLQDIIDGKYLEAELIHGQQVSGMSVRELLEARDEGKIAINEVDIGGIHAVVKVKPDTVAVIVLPPSFEEWQKRLKGRGHMHQDEYRRRLRTAVRVFSDAATHDYFTLFVNDDLQRITRQIHQLATTGEVDTEEQRRNRQLAASLSEETRLHLESLG